MAKTHKILQLNKEGNYSEKEENKNRVKKEEGDNVSAMVSIASELGFSISLPIAGGALLGQYIDGKLGTSPRVTLSLIFTGLILGIINIYRLLKITEKK